ncbi:MAG: hypothetical protein AAFP90_08960 [Planctomycetota bacterium]
MKRTAKTRYAKQLDRTEGYPPNHRNSTLCGRIQAVAPRLPLSPARGSIQVTLMEQVIVASRRRSFELIDLDR